MLRLPDQEILLALRRASDALADGGPILKVLAPPPGPYALFYHLGHAAERARDVAEIFERMRAGRERLNEATLAAEAQRPRHWPAGVVYPESFGRRMAVVVEIERGLKIDYESVFHFGSVLLDQWAYATGYLGGFKKPETFTFDQLVLHLDKAHPATVLSPVRHQLREHARWLHFWMRTYRNSFVIHATRPWQRGMIVGQGLSGTDFALFNPSPPGWENDDELKKDIASLLQLVPSLRRTVPSKLEVERPGLLLERVIRSVGQVDRQADRERIAHVAQRAGVTTPTFQIIVSVLAHLVDSGTLLVQKEALRSPGTIVLGVGGRSNRL